MSIFDELEAQYREIDKCLSSSEFKGRKHGSARKENRYERRRKRNDEAYFLFMFTRLEDHIKRESKKLIERKQKAPRHILPNQTKGEFSFMDRLTLLTEKDGSDFNQVSGYYEERNAIAHGGTFTDRITVRTVAFELKRLYKVLKA